MLTSLPRVIAGPEAPAGSGDADHPMRHVTRQVAFGPGGWTAERRAKVADLFTSLAPEWNTRIGPGRHDPLTDALARGLDGAPTAGPVLEVGSGTGDSTELVAARYPRTVAVDLSLAMLVLAPSGAAPRLQADASMLPVADGALDAVVLVNALLFPAEVDRVLAPAGRVVWVNTSGPRTPIHLPADDVIAALPGDWDAVASEAGNGTWCVAHRA